MALPSGIKLTRGHSAAVCRACEKNMPWNRDEEVLTDGQDNFWHNTPECAPKAPERPAAAPIPPPAPVPMPAPSNGDKRPGNAPPPFWGVSGDVTQSDRERVMLSVTIGAKDFWTLRADLSLPRKEGETDEAWRERIRETVWDELRLNRQRVLEEMRQ